MGFSGIEKYLNKFKKFKPPRKFLQDEVVNIIQQNFGIFIEANEIKEAGGILYFKIKNPVLKNEIFINKDKILEKLSQRIGPRAPKDIKF